MTEKNNAEKRALPCKKEANQSLIDVERDRVSNGLLSVNRKES